MAHTVRVLGTTEHLFDLRSKLKIEELFSCSVKIHGSLNKSFTFERFIQFIRFSSD